MIRNLYNLRLIILANVIKVFFKFNFYLRGTANVRFGKLSFLFNCGKVNNFDWNLVNLCLIALVFFTLKSRGRNFFFKYFNVVVTVFLESPSP